MKGLLFFIIPILLLLCSCTNNYDKFRKEKLKYYHDVISQKERKGIQFNGFYYRKVDTLEFHTGNKVGWPNQVEAIYFYADGSFNYGSVYECLDSLISEETRYHNKKYLNMNWGLYKIAGDTIYVEFVDRKALLLKNVARFELLCVMRSEKISIIKTDWDYRSPEPYIFKEFEYKPDSTKNWVLKNRKINTNK